VYDLSQLPAGQRGWSILMGISTILAILLSRSYDSNVMVDALDRYGYSLNYAYYFGTNLCISFLIEDTATLMLFSTVSGAFNRDSLADVLNLVSSLASAVMVSVFILIGGTKLIFKGRSADWIPHLSITLVAQWIAKALNWIDINCIMSFFIFLKCLWIVISVGWSVYLVVGFILPGRLLSSGDSLGVLTKVIYAHSFLLGVLVSLRIPKGRKQKIPEFFMKREEDDENYEDGVALTSTSTSKQEIV